MSHGNVKTKIWPASSNHRYRVAAACADLHRDRNSESRSQTSTPDTTRDNNLGFIDAVLRKRGSIGHSTSTTASAR